MFTCSLKGKIMDRKERKIEKEKKKERKRIRKIRREMPEYKLHLLWNREVKKSKPKDLIYILIYIVGNIDYLPLQKRALRHFLAQNNLTFDNFDRMINASRSILGNDVSLKEKFYKQCFAICTENNLAELGETANAEAIKELIRRVKTGSGKNSSGLRGLIRLFEKATIPETRMELWKIIRKFDPCERDLIELHNMVYGKYGFQKIVEDIQKHLKRKKKETTKKTILKIEELMTQIKQGQE